jgi:hypothetical protein
MILAARFALYTNDFEEAARISQKLQNSSGRNSQSSATSVFEIEAFCIDNWCFLNELESSQSNYLSSEQKRRIQSIDAHCKSKNGEQSDIDTLMLWAKSRQILNGSSAYAEVLNILNQV